MSTVLIFIFVILVLVVVHELGHFFVAKAFKIRVDEFGIGYPPRAKSLFSWKGTVFSLNWLPFGGFVKIYGEKPETEEEIQGSFAYAKLYKRLLVIIAGIVANIILAIVLYSASFSIGFLGSTASFPNAKVIQEEKIIITDVEKGSPAEISGIISGDQIDQLTFKDEKVVPKTIDELTAFIRAHKDEEVVVDLIRAKREVQISVTPKLNSENNASIGIAIVSAGKIRLPILSAISEGAKNTCYEFKNTISSLYYLVKGAIAGQKGLLTSVSGPVGIAKFAGVAYGLGLGTLLSFAGLISINLAVINLLPFPALDGGRFILEFFSKNGQSKIGTRVVSAVNQVGFLLLIVLMLYITYKDIAKLFA